MRLAAPMALAAMAEAPVDCSQCPRLVAYRRDNARKHPDWFNAPVPSFGGLGARLLVIGLAPGVSGANRTGRPFTGDYAGDLLYATLQRFGFARGTYGASKDDGLELVDCRISNAVRCVPPENKPTPEEATRCRPFLAATFEAMPDLRVVVALGRIAHDSAIRALKLKAAAHVFGHAAEHALPRGVTLIDSYHCSRYNTNTGRLTEDMFAAVFARARTLTART